jgi:hypothetical protein
MLSWTRDGEPTARGIHCSPVIFTSIARPASPYSDECVCVYADISDCVVVVCEVPLLPNKYASETF